MNIIFTDYTKEEFKKLEKHKYISSTLSFLFGFLSIFFIIKFFTTAILSYMTLSMFSLLLCTLASINFLRFNNAKCNYLKSLNKSGKENVVSQVYDSQHSRLIITYKKDNAEIKDYVSLNAMKVKQENLITETTINFDTNEIIKPVELLVVGGFSEGKTQSFGSDKE